MSPHHRRQSISQPISWLAHRTGFPSEAERQALIRRREKLRDELLPVLLQNYGPDDPPGRQLVQKYGWEEVEWAIAMIDKSMEMTSFIASETHSYRLYRHSYARFGGQRPFYSYPEHSAIEDEDLDFHIERFRAGRISSKKPREQELDDLLLLDWLTWKTSRRQLLHPIQVISNPQRRPVTGSRPPPSLPGVPTSIWSVSKTKPKSRSAGSAAARARTYGTRPRFARRLAGRSTKLGALARFAPARALWKPGSPPRPWRRSQGDPMTGSPTCSRSLGAHGYGRRAGLVGAAGGHEYTRRAARSCGRSSDFTTGV